VNVLPPGSLTSKKKKRNNFSFLDAFSYSLSNAFPFFLFPLVLLFCRLLSVFTFNFVFYILFFSQVDATDILI
jgi:hypothetical protein